MTGTRRPPFPRSRERMDPMTVQADVWTPCRIRGQGNPLQNPGGHREGGGARRTGDSIRPLPSSARTRKAGAGAAGSVACFSPSAEPLGETRRAESMEKLNPPRQDGKNARGEGGKRGQTFRTFPPKNAGRTGQGWSRFRTPCAEQLGGAPGRGGPSGAGREARGEPSALSGVAADMVRRGFSSGPSGGGKRRAARAVPPGPPYFFPDLPPPAREGGSGEGF